jgi:hypothetical protein
MTRHLALMLSLLLALCVPSAAFGQIPSAPQPQAASISGTVVDPDGAAIPHATVNLQGATADDKFSVTADDSGAFRIAGLKAGESYSVSVTAKGFGTTTVKTETLTPGAESTVAGLILKPAVDETVSAATTKEVAMEEVYQETHQRVLGIIPNYYVVYDRSDEVPLSTGLKYKLAVKSIFDVMTLGGAMFVAGMDQAAHTPAYVEGARGFGQRVGYNYAGAASDVFFGGAVLPSLFHQDPRYYYKGTGTKKSRMMHALASPILCKGDNGKTQFNISSVGGDLVSGAIAQTYTPARDRGFSAVLTSALIVTGGREINSLFQEFVYAKLTTHAKAKH